MHHLVYMGRQDGTTYSCPAHSHPRWEITYYTEGEGVNITDGVEYPFAAGTVICQPPFVEHTDRSVSGYKNIFFEVETFHDTSPVPIVAHDTEGGDFLSVMRQMYFEYFTENDTKITEALLNVLSVYLNRRLQAPDSSPLVEQFKKDLLFNYTDPHYQILQVMQRLPLSESQFRRLFRRETGMTPQAFLQTTRLEHAQQLLRNSTLPVAQVANLCGYGDAYYFSRIFKQVFGLAPRDWRAAHCGDYPCP